MASISGQFHTYSTKSAAKRLTGNDFLARFERRGRVEDQAHPAVAMIDDDDRVVAPEWARETDDAGCGNGDGGTAGGRKSQAARTNAVRSDGTEAFDDWGRRGECVGEGRRLDRFGRPWSSRRCGQTGKFGGNDARLAAALDFAGQLSGFFAAG